MTLLAEVVVSFSQVLTTCAPMLVHGPRHQSLGDGFTYTTVTPHHKPTCATYSSSLMLCRVSRSTEVCTPRAVLPHHCYCPGGSATSLLAAAHFTPRPRFASLIAISRIWEASNTPSLVLVSVQLLPRPVTSRT